MSSVTKPSTSDATPDTAPPPPPPGAQIFQMWTGVMVTQLLEVALGHQLPRRLLDGARSSAELAEMTGLHEPSLYRVLRALTMFGIFDEQPERRFTLGPLGPTAAEYEDGFRWGVAAINEVPRTVQDGTPGMELAHGMSFFEYLTEHPAAGRNFDVAQSLINGGSLRRSPRATTSPACTRSSMSAAATEPDWRRCWRAMRTCAACCSTSRR